MSSRQPEPGIPGAGIRATSWVLYDLANTIYAAAITYLFVPYIQHASSVGLTTMLSMVLAGVATPVFASLSDRTGRAGRYCSVTTLVCIACMAFLSAGRPEWGLLIAYFVANLCYQAALVFYNSLLPSVAGQDKMGRVSGLGVGLGYLGTVFTLIILLPVREHFKDLSWRPEYLVGAAAFLVIALPQMLLVRDRRPITPERVTGAMVRGQWRELLLTLRALPTRPKLMWFLIANFFAVDVLNTAILYYGRFVEVSFRTMLDQGRLALFGRPIDGMAHFVTIAGACVTVPALVFGLLTGWLADRWGSARAYVFSLVFLLAGLIGAIIFSGWAPGLFLLSMSVFAGIGLAGIWTAGRKLLIELVPRELVGRYFGLYGITNKVSVLGCAVCGVLMDTLGFRVAILGEVVTLIPAFYCLWRMARAEGPATGFHDEDHEGHEERERPEETR